MNSFFAFIISKATVAGAAARAKIADKKGLSDLIMLVILIVIGCVLAVAIFYPQISKMLTNFLSGAETKVTSILNLA